jgi:hypothetical protein
MKKALETAIEMKDRLIKDLRNELFDKQEKIEHLKYKVNNLKRDLHKIITYFSLHQHAGKGSKDQNTNGGPSLTVEQLVASNDDDKIKHYLNPSGQVEVATKILARGSLSTKVEKYLREIIEVMTVIKDQMAKNEADATKGGVSGLNTRRVSRLDFASVKGSIVQSIY